MLGVELRRVIQKPAMTRIARPRMIRIRVIQPLQIPTLYEARWIFAVLLFLAVASFS